MNKKAQELRLKSTHFVTPHGLDEKEHYTTAYELALISDYALNIDKIKEVVKTKEYTVNINNYSKTIRNTNELLGYLNGVNGVKTGFTNGAGRCLVTSINRNGFNIITVVLSADTKKMRTKDSIKLIEYIYSNYELVNLEEIVNSEFINFSNINKKRIEICKSKNKNVNIGIDKCMYKYYPVKKDEINDIKVEIENIKLYFVAPVFENTKLANMKVKIEDKQILNLDIFIKNKIERKNWKDYIKECLEVF